MTTFLKAFKSIKFEGAKLNTTWYSAPPRYHKLWNFSELCFSIIFSIFKLFSIIIILICRKLGSAGPVQQKIKLHSPYTKILQFTWYHSYTYHMYIFIIWYVHIIVNKNCIILYFYISCHIKEKCSEFLFFITFFVFWSLVRNQNIKRTGFYTLQVTRLFSNFLQFKQLSKIKDSREYCDLHELWYAWVGDPR